MFDPKEEERMMKRAFARYVIPTVIALVFEQIAPIVDSLCISHALGEEALSAISTVDPVYYFFGYSSAWRYRSRDRDREGIGIGR